MPAVRNSSSSQLQPQYFPSPCQKLNPASCTALFTLLLYSSSSTYAWSPDHGEEYANVCGTQCTKWQQHLLNTELKLIKSHVCLGCLEDSFLYNNSKITPFTNSSSFYGHAGPVFCPVSCETLYFIGLSIGKNVTKPYASRYMGHDTIISRYITIQCILQYIAIFKIVHWKCKSRAETTSCCVRSGWS